MKVKRAAFIIFITLISVIYFTYPPQDFKLLPCQRSSYCLNAKDNETDAINNITRAEDSIHANYELLFGAELNDGEVWYLYIYLSFAIVYLNAAQVEYLNGSYINAINNAEKSYSISQSIIPISIFKSFEAISIKQFQTNTVPFLIIISVISTIIGIILAYHIIKNHQFKKKDDEFLKKKISVSNNELQDKNE